MSSSKQVLSDIVSNSNKVMAVDISMADTGIVTYDRYADLYTFDSLKSSKKDFINQYHRTHYVVENIILKFRESECDQVWVEGPSFNSKSSSFTQLMEFCGIVKHILRELSERPLIIVPPTTVKSLFVGKGNCNKEAMLIKANQVLPKYYESINNNNIADAFAIAYIASRCYSDITFRDFTLTKVSIY